jgi:hypothetical protein
MTQFGFDVDIPCMTYRIPRRERTSSSLDRTLGRKDERIHVAVSAEMTSEGMGGPGRHPQMKGDHPNSS